MADAQYDREWDEARLVAGASVAYHEVWQMPGGKAGVYVGLPIGNGLNPVAASSGDRSDFRTSGKWTVAKTTGASSPVFLDGGRVYWDHSANTATYKKVNDRDFYIGRAVGDYAAGDPVMVVDLNADPPPDIDLLRDGYRSALLGAETIQIGTRAKVGGTAGWTVGAADNLPYVATLAASQTGSTLIIPIDGLRIGDVITGFRVVSQIESAGNTVTIDGDLRATTNVAAEPTDASIGTMTQVSVTADTASSQAKTGLSETVTSGKTYYLKITATTAASTDIILQACEITVQPAVCNQLARRGGALNFSINSVGEAQKLDALSLDGFARTANAIVEAIFTIVNDGSGSAVDVNIGLANATHATDADSITESLFVHIDAGSTNIAIESDDGTNEVAATDSTLDYTEGSGIANRVEVWFDLRNEADIQVYVNAANVLPGSTFRLDNATGPLKLLAHVEKTAATDTYELDLERLCVRFSEQ